MVRAILRASVLLAAGFVLAAPATAGAADLSATPATLGSAFDAAQPGDTIRLAPGDYGTFHAGVKPGLVTLAPAPGAAATIAPSLTDAAHVAFDGLTIDGAYVSGSTDVTFRNSVFTGMTRVDADVANAGIVFDHDTFDGIDQCSSCYEGRITVRGFGDDTPSGVRISNSHFGNGGASDGIQITGGAYGVQIGPGNEFSGLRQGSGSTHVDPIQLYGSSHTLITGNYFHDNSTGIMAPNGGDTETIVNNVFVMDEYPWAVIGGYQPNLTVVHDTMVGGALRLDDYSGGSGDPTSAVVRDNVLANGFSWGTLQPGAVQEDYNLIPSGGTGPHDIRARPRFVGGAAPTGYAGFALAPGAPGTSAASDGHDMGIDLTAGAQGTPGGQGVQSASSGPGLDEPPTLRLLGPAAGRLGRVLTLRAAASDDRGITRVELWIDARRVARRTRAPYTTRRRVGAALRHGAHTISARAYDSSGQATSVAAAISHDRVLAGRVVTAPAAGGGTAVRASGFGRHPLRIRLARCAGGHLRTFTLHRGHHAARLAAGRLCVIGVRPR
jgi:Bacterial Ig domain/Periplasmic copper-binding protein (NosD)